MVRGVAAQLYVHGYEVEVNGGEIGHSTANDENFFQSVFMMYKIPFALVPPSFYILCSGVESVTFRDAAEQEDAPKEEDLEPTTEQYKAAIAEEEALEAKKAEAVAKHSKYLTRMLRCPCCGAICQTCI